MRHQSAPHPPNPSTAEPRNSTLMTDLHSVQSTDVLTLRRTVLDLADGRELIYFDEPDAPSRTALDTRPLPATPAGSTMRYDALLDEWVAIAAQRQDRIFLPPADLCPLCPSTPGNPSEIPSDSYDVVVFENRFPSFAGIPEPIENRAGTADTEDGPLGVTPQPLDEPERPAVGRCEVVCFTSEHTSSFAELSVRRAELVIAAWADRTVRLSRLPGVEQVFPFENRGQAIGVTLHHPHGQIYAYPFLPPRTRTMLDAATAHRSDTGARLGESLLQRELETGDRIVFQHGDWVAFVPFAARWPIEVHLRSTRPVPDFAALDEKARADLAVAYLDLLGRLDRVYDRPLPYVAAWHQAPVRIGRDLLDLHLEIFSVQRAADRLKYLAGSESAMGVFVNDRNPEDVAAQLRRLGDHR